MAYRPLGAGFDFTLNSSGLTANVQPPQVSIPSVSVPSVSLPNISVPTNTPDSSPAMISLPSASATPLPDYYDQDGMRYTAAPGNYTGQSPANVFCQGGNKPPCACVTRELRDYILNNSLCTVTNTPKAIQVKGVGVSSIYSVYTGMPEGTFKWYDKWITDTGIFNPCQVMQLPVCKTDCNTPWFEPTRIDPNYGYCKSTEVKQTYSVYAKPVTSVYVPHAPVTVTPTCPKGSHPSSGGCSPDVGTGAPATSSSSGYLTGGLLLLLIAAGGGVYYMSQKKKKGGK